MARILIIDDEELVRFTIRQILEAAGHDVGEAKNGAEGLTRFKTNPYELVITDIIMPEKEGIETIIELHRDFPATRIIAISGGGRTRNLDFLKLAGQFGAAVSLAKPFSDDELIAAVDSCLAM